MCPDSIGDILFMSVEINPQRKKDRVTSVRQTFMSSPASKVKPVDGVKE